MALLYSDVTSLAEAQKRIMATPGFSAAGQVARRFDKCYFSLARGKSRDGVLAAMNYCECKVDAQRAGYGASRAAELSE